MKIKKKRILAFLAIIFRVYSYLSLFALLLLTILLPAALWAADFLPASLPDDLEVRAFAKLVHFVTSPEFRSVLWMAVTCLVANFLCNFYGWRLLSKLTKEIEAGGFFGQMSARLLSRLRNLLLLSVAISLLFTISYNQLTSDLVPIFADDLLQMKGYVGILQDIIKISWSEVLAIEPTPTLKIILALVCTLGLEKIRNIERTDAIGL